MKRGFLLLLLVAVAMGSFIGYKQYTKPADKAEDVEALENTVEQVMLEFFNDETAARQKFIGKALQLNGAFTTAEKNVEGDEVLIFETGVTHPILRATLRDATALPPAGSNITFRGFCDAYMPGEDMAGMQLPGTVVMTDCILIN